MTRFELADLEKIHLAVDMARRFVRGESYHGDKPQVLLQEFDRLMQKVHDQRQSETFTMENDHHLGSNSVQDADHGNFTSPYSK